jgi:hypothetical protein
MKGNSMKRHQKRYSERDEIIKAIDDRHKIQAEECVLVDALDAEADNLFVLASRELDEEQMNLLHYNAQCKRDEAGAIRKRQQTHKRELLSLKHTLAAFDTMPMSFLEDASVVKC